MTVRINGESKAFPPGEADSIAALVAFLGLKQDRIAIEHNGQLAARARWAEMPIREGDSLEIVHFVGGGA